MLFFSILLYLSKYILVAGERRWRTEDIPVSGVSEIVCEAHPAQKTRIGAHAATRIQLWHLREVVPDEVGVGATRADSYGRASVPVRGVPEELRAEGDPVQTFDDAHGTEALQLPALSEGLHAKGAAQSASQVAYESESVGYPAALLYLVSEGVLSCVWFEQTLGHAHGEDFQVQRMR